MPLAVPRRAARLTVLAVLFAALAAVFAQPARAALFFGTPGGDTIRPGVANDHAWGNGGNDTITDRGGKDYLHGGAGNDRITGDARDTIIGSTGDDTIVLTTAAGLAFRVDCGTGADRVTVQDPGKESDAAIRARMSGCETITIVRAASPEPTPAPTPPADTVVTPPAPEPEPQPEPKPTPPPAPEPDPLPRSSSAGFLMGVHTGARTIDYRATASLKPGLVRVGGLGARTTRSEIAAIAAEYAALGARIVPLVDFNSAAPSEADARNVGTWATVKGVEAIEFGNEPWLQNESWDYAQYARSFKAAHDAVAAANPHMTLIAVGDSANRSHRPGLRVMQAMKAVGVKPRAVQFHPYGPGWGNRLYDLKRDLADMGWTGTQIWATETGVASDNGRTLNDNYGWNRAMTYAEAATTTEQIVNGLRAGGVARVMLYMGTDYAAPGTSSEREYYFGLTTSTNGDKGALTSKARSLLALHR